MTDLITEARELATENISQPTVFYKDKSQRIMLRLCDALENANEQNKQLLHEVCKLACESVERDKALAKLEAEVEVALGKGCDCCGLIYAIHAESYGIEDLDCANEPIDNKFCPMCGKRLEVEP